MTAMRGGLAFLGASSLVVSPPPFGLSTTVVGRTIHGAATPVDTTK
jgi:hypothetical protein